MAKVGSDPGVLVQRVPITGTGKVNIPKSVRDFAVSREVTRLRTNNEWTTVKHS